MKQLFILLFAALPLLSQPWGSRYSASTGNVSLSAAGTALTIQQPATNASVVNFETATIYCSVACVVSQAQNGTAATATAGTAVAISPSGPAAAATVWTASNVGAGTSVPPAINLSAGSTLVLDLSKVTLPHGGSQVNYTISVGSITGTANITMIWKENR